MSGHTTFREPATLGRTGLKVGRLGVGASYGVPAAALERAFHEYGVNYFYWGSFRRPGMRDAIRAISREARDRLVVALQSYDRTGLLMAPFVERALASARIERADVLILGWYDDVPPRRVLDAALAVRERGLVRFLALSGHRRPLFAEVANDPASPFDVLMLRYSAAHRGAEREVFPRLPAENRPGVTAYTATRWGQLLDPKRMPEGEAPLTAADCYRFALTSPSVDLCMTGPADAAQMEAALAAIDLGPLTDDELARARRVGDRVAGREAS